MQARRLISTSTQRLLQRLTNGNVRSTLSPIKPAPPNFKQVPETEVKFYPKEMYVKVTNPELRKIYAEHVGLPLTKDGAILINNKNDQDLQKAGVLVALLKEDGQGSTAKTLNTKIESLQEEAEKERAFKVESASVAEVRTKLGRKG